VATLASRAAAQIYIEERDSAFSAGSASCVYPTTGWRLRVHHQLAALPGDGRQLREHGIFPRRRAGSRGLPLLRGRDEAPGRREQHAAGRRGGFRLDLAHLDMTATKVNNAQERCGRWRNTQNCNPPGSRRGSPCRTTLCAESQAGTSWVGSPPGCSSWRRQRSRSASSPSRRPEVPPVPGARRPLRQHEPHDPHRFGRLLPQGETRPR